MEDVEGLVYKVMFPVIMNVLIVIQISPGDSLLLTAEREILRYTMDYLTSK
jgi:hypothetical protein